MATKPATNGRSQVPPDVHGGIPTYDGDAVIEQLAAQVGALTAQILMRDSAIQNLRGRIAQLEAAQLEAKAPT